MRFGPIDIWDIFEGFGAKKGLFLRGGGYCVGTFELIFS